MARTMRKCEVQLISAVDCVEDVHNGFDYLDPMKLIYWNYNLVQAFNLLLPSLPLCMSGGVGLIASNR